MSSDSIEEALRSEVDRGRFPGFSYAVIWRGQVKQGCVGYANLERSEAMRLDHLFRIFSGTKLITSCAALQLWERGQFKFDDAIGDYIPELARLKVLSSPSAGLETAVRSAEPIRIKHLLTHTAGLTYSFISPDSPIAKAYLAARVGSPATSLSQQMAILSDLPLLFEPGRAWNYSVATDVIGRLVEVLSGLSLDNYFEQRIFAPLGMVDTFFFVPEEKQSRLATHYIGDSANPLRPGLTLAENIPFAGAFKRPSPRLNPGGGLVSSLGDYTRLIKSLLEGGSPILQPESVRLIAENQLPEGMHVGFPDLPLPGRGHSFAATVFVEPTSWDPAAVPGDVQWGGLSATRWMMNPRTGLGLVLMTQRYLGSELGYWPKFKNAVLAQLRS